MKRTAIAITCALFLLTFALAPVSAKATYPDRPVTIIIPFGPGGAVDIAARVLAEYLQAKHNIILNIVCKPGGAGAPAMLEVSTARPDGYTYGFPAVTTITITPQVKECGYTIKNLRGVAQVMVLWPSLAVRTDSPYKTFQEFMDAAKANPGKINYATHGALSTQRLFMSRILNKKFPDYNVPHIAYASGHEISTAVLGGHVVSAFGSTSNHTPYVASGEFRILGVASPNRLKEFPDVPTFKEMLGDEFVFASSHGLVAPVKTPDDKVKAMQDLIKEALADATVQEKLYKAGMHSDFMAAGEFQELILDYNRIIGETLKTISF